ncbi:MAG: DoxX family protein [Bacteroidota bacterium]|mgnify:FL=1|nr:DoxX family protein [Bacteroidota bacterium]|tara:strand:+ start:118 stop:495 length:378 start_codon:yes stop_codon:yes gene_type:complete
MKKATKLFSLLISITVISAWTIRFNLPSVFRGGEAENMLEEFTLYGLSNSTMIIVGVTKVIISILLVLGAFKFKPLVKPSAGIMAIFMIGAVYFHFSVGDGFIPTIPSASMLLSCFIILFLESKS